MAAVVTKKWYRSRTFWYNAAVTLVALGNELLPLLQVMDNPAREELRMWLIFATTFGNAILRVVTQTKVTL